MQVFWSRKFQKDFKKLDDSIRKKFFERLELFHENPYDPLLNLHKLAGRYAQYFSINITGDFRLIFKHSNKHIELISIGTRAKLYK